MERVRLRIVLDDVRRTYAVGGAVAGRVEVELDEDCTCDGVTVSLGWATGGDANEHAEDPASEAIAGGEWKGGDRFSLPFSLAVPPGPPTYEGKRLSVSWRVVATAALDWATDPEAQEAVSVLPAAAPEGTLVAKEETGCLAVGCAWVLVLFVLGAAACLLAGRSSPVEGEVAAVLGFAAFLLALYFVPRAFTAHRLGKVTLEAGPSPCPRGGEVAVRVVLRPRKDLAPSRITAVLEAVERSVKGTGKGKSTREEVVRSATATLEGPPRIEKFKEAVYAGIVEVPADPPVSFEAGPHAVLWRLKVKVALPRATDAEWTLDVAVA